VDDVADLRQPDRLDEILVATGAPRRRRPRAVAVLAALLVLAGAAPARGQAPVELSEAAVIEREAAVEVWVRLSRAAKYRSELMDSPWRLVLDFEDTAYRWTARPVPVAIDPVRELRGSQYRQGIARLVIELRRKVAYTIEQDREGLRIVLPRDGVAGAAAGPRVHGIIILDQQAHAYIFDPATRQVRRYAVGDALGDAVVETIAERHVVLKTPAGRVELRVEEARPAPAPPPAARPR
jgi:hypothetical protein